MAPMCPEEVDVFTIPHTRMKELVEEYLHMLTSTNFADALHFTNMLENLCKTFREFIAHEQIENRYIMKKLKNKLHSLSIENNAVCNCHKDNQLTDMLNLLQDGYKCTKKSDTDRGNYGTKLRQALETFTQTFIPHMEEEEEVFQPLLMQHFSVEELKQIKATVIEQHFRIEADERPEKFVHDNKSCKLGKKVEQFKSRELLPPSKIEKLPDEVFLKIFSNLNPQDLIRASQVSTRWQQLAMDGSLWTSLFPVSWAKGNWDAVDGVYEEESEESVEKKLEQKVHDEDADVDETEDGEDWDAEALEIQRQSAMLTSMCKNLLPLVGPSVKHCDLAYSKGLTNGALYKILSLCPNLEYLDLTQTRISDLGFKGLLRDGCGEKLRHVDLTGCLYITDKTLERLAQATRHNTTDAGDVELTSHSTEPDTELDSLMTEPNSHVIKPVSHVNKPKSHGTELSRCVNEQSNLSQSFNLYERCQMTDEDFLLEERDTQDEKQDYKKATREQSCEQDDEDVDEDGNSGKGGALNEVCDTECSSQCKPSNAGMEQASAGLEDALSRLRCCHSNKGCCCCDTDIETSQTARKCCRRGGGVYCEGCPWRQGQKGERSRTSNHNTSPDQRKFDKCHGHAEKGERSRTINEYQLLSIHGRALSFDNEGEMSRAFSNDLSHEDDRKSPASEDKGQRSSVVPCAEPPGPSAETVMDGTKVDSTPSPLHETIVDVSNDPADVLNEETQPENWEIPGLTFIPELYIIPDDRPPSLNSDLNPDDLNNASVECESAKNKTREGDEVTCGRRLQFLSLSGCYQITDLGLQFLTAHGGLPNLRHLDLSGCLNLSGETVSQLVTTAGRLEPPSLFYCDNIVDGPYTDTASGCQNLQCVSRVCCRVGD